MHSVFEIEPSHRELYALPFELSPGSREEFDRGVVAAPIRARAARSETVPARKGKRPRIVVVVTLSAPPWRETNRWRVSRRVHRHDHVLDHGCYVHCAI